MKTVTRTLACAAIAFVLTIGCGGKPTMASKSAAAYREAQAKGISVGGDEKHGHGSMTPPGGDHAAMGHDAVSVPDHAGHSDSTADAHAAHRGMATPDHAAMGHDTARDHGGHAGTTARSDPHAGHAMTPSSRTAVDPHAQHRTQAVSQDPHAGHTMTEPSREVPDPHAQHRAQAAPDPHAEHRAPVSPRTKVDVAPPASSRDISLTKPATTLRVDEFDAPSPVSVSEAAKPAPAGGHDDHSMHQSKPPKEMP